MCLAAAVLVASFAAATPRAVAEPPAPSVPTAVNVAQQGQEPARFDGHKVVRVTPRSTRDVRTVLALTDDIWTCSAGVDANSSFVSLAPFDVRVTPDAFDALRDSGVPFTTIIENVQALIDAERAPRFGPRGPGFFTDYHNYADVSGYIDTLIALRPDMASRFTIGTTLAPANTPIFGMRIAAPGVAPGSKPAVVIYGCEHAREWITVMSTMYIADQLIRNNATDSGLQRLLTNYEFYIFPIMNPDGYQFTWNNYRLWRKNRRTNTDGSVGVDINRNWGWHWGGLGSSPAGNNDVYCGTGAFSENESQALSNFIIAHPNTVLSFDLHSYSQIILEPNAWDWSLPADTRAYTQITAAIQSAMFAPFSNPYTGGETYRVIYPAAGGSHDWVANVRGAIGYGIELRDTGTNGFLLPAAQIVPASTEAMAGVFAAANWLVDNAIAASFPGAGKPQYVYANGSTSVQVQFARGMKSWGVPVAPPAVTPPTITVYSRIGRNGPFTASAIANLGTDEGGPVYLHYLPGGPCGSVTQWYYSATFADSTTVTAPIGGAAAPYEVSAKSALTIFSDDFESAGTWTVGDTTPGQADTATTGLWTRTDPNGTLYQAEYDCTPLGGTNCYITGQNARGDTSAGQVVSGKTTLMSPVFNAAGSTKLDASFWLWNYAYSSMNFYVDATNNALASTPTWTRILTIGPTSPINQIEGRWNRFTIRLTDSLPSSSQMRLRFVAANFAAVAYYEAGLDEVRIVSFSCEKNVCAADYNADGVLSTQDIFDYLGDWFAGSPRTDVNGGGVSVQDIFDFLNTWFAGC
jgi:hypothetical protein